MDIMNNMTVSTSKLTFSLIAVATLLIAGSAFTNQEAFAANAPEFTAIHINTTATHITFDMSVNGTLAIHDWSIKHNSTATLSNATPIAGSQATQVSITNIANASSTGVGLTVPSTGDKRVSNIPTGITNGLGFINGTDIVIIHEAIPSGSTYFINYTNNYLTTTAGATIAGGFGAIHANNGGNTGGEGASTNSILKIGSNATAKDWMIPTVTSADIFKDNPQQVVLTMSEPVTNVNSTLQHFVFTTSGGGNDAVPATIFTNNVTSFIYIELQNAVTTSDILTIEYDTDGDNNDVGLDSWITDAVDTTKYVTSGATDSALHLQSGHGNRLANFTAMSITNWITTGFFGDVTTCYDCEAPIVTKVQISLDSSIPVTVTGDDKVHINAGIDDTVSVMVTVADNLGADTIPFAGLYTNFGATPDNLYYANNFDSAKQMSTSYYEWNVRTDNIAFDNDGAITWTDATAKVNADRTQTFTYTMTIKDSIESSQIWVDIGDKVGNYAKIALPITLEVSGAPGLTFASDDTQKVVSFFNESILLAIVSQWTATSSDDASNVEQLSSVLGIESQLPTWTTDLASWVADDKIDVADMIVAVEYVINQ